MNIMGLMSRGYLGGGGLVVSRPPPQIMSSAEMSPPITGSRAEKTVAPVGVGSTNLKPSISGAGAGTTGPAPSGPSIVGSKDVKPE